MGRSFFNGSTDGELATGSRAFAEQISLSPSVYGISEEQAALYAALDAQWHAAYLAARDPSTRTRGKVTAKDQARERVTAMASSLAKIIGGNPDVTDAQRIGLGLSVRAKASPLPPPGKPSQLSTALDGDGSLILTWKCDNPAGSRGTQYEVWRKIGGGEFVFLRSVGEKRFRDHTLPRGATGIVYKLIATRTTKRGEWAMFPVYFGGGHPNAGEMHLAA